MKPDPLKSPIERVRLKEIMRLSARKRFFDKIKKLKGGKNDTK